MRRDAPKLPAFVGTLAAFAVPFLINSATVQLTVAPVMPPHANGMMILLFMLSCHA